MNKNDIKRYIVQVKGKEFTGSGVLIQSNNKNFYIFTAKHNLAYDEEDKKNVQNIKLENIKYDIQCNKIKILSFYPNIKISDVIFLDNTILDFVILKVEKESVKSLQIEQLKIFNDDFKECTVAGYPIIRGNDSKGYFDCFYETKVEDDEERDDYQNTFEVYSTKPLYTYENKEMETIAGISGGGVFVKGSDDNIYLAGIEIEYIGITNLVCISLRDIIDEVNKKLEDMFNDKIEIGGFSLYEKFGIDVTKLELNSIKEEISEKNTYIETLKKEKGEDDEYTFLKNPKNDYFREINKKYKDVGNLAKAFLYNGIVFHENKDYNRATRHFKKAVKLDPNLEVYFSQSKFKREKGLSDKQKKEIEKNIANLSSNNEEQLIKNLIESIKNKDELESKIRHLNHLLYKKIDLSLFNWFEETNLITSYPKLNFKQTFIDIRKQIIQYTKELSDFYLKEKDFQNSQRQLKGLIVRFQLLYDLEINKKLLKIYEESQNDFFGNSCIDRTLLLDELLSLKEKFESNSDEDKRIKKMIKNISKVDDKYADKYIEFTEKINNFEKDYDKKIGSLSLGLKNISNNIVDKDVLIKIDFMLEHLTNSHGSLNLKLDRFEENRIESKKNYQNIMKIFKMIMQKVNKNLEDSIKAISNRNSIETRLMLNQLLRRIERGLDITVIVEKDTNFSEFDKSLKKIVADEIENFYKKINNSKSIIDEKNRIIKLIQERYGEHVFSLKKSLKDKNQKITSLEIHLKFLKQWLDEINKEYEAKKVKSKEVELKVQELTDMNKVLEQKILSLDDNSEDLIKLEKYKYEIKYLEELTKKLKYSIESSSKTVHSLNILEKKNSSNIEKLEKVISNPKSGKQLKRISRQVKGNEQKLENIKKEVKKGQKITLKLSRANLEKIGLIIRDYKKKSHKFYCGVRQVIIGIIFMMLIIALFANEPYSTLIKEVSIENIINYFR